MIRDVWKIVDRETGERVTVLSYFSRAQAEAQITAWQDRHDRGGRPDISRELLLRMTPIREDFDA